jgi:hypothetical protein
MLMSVIRPTPGRREKAEMNLEEFALDARVTVFQVTKEEACDWGGKWGYQEKDHPAFRINRI